MVPVRWQQFQTQDFRQTNRPMRAVLDLRKLAVQQEDHSHRNCTYKGLLHR